ncbi:MAG: hypothetical protein WC972_03090 [Trueperaceae bacterium]
MATIQFADVLDHQLLPIDSQDVVTKVRLVVAGSTAGDIAEVHQKADTPGGAETRAYVPWPVTFEYEAPEHAVYGAERSFALPAGVNPFLPPTSPAVGEPNVVSGFSNPGAPSAIRDGDPLTYAEWTAGLGVAGRLSYGLKANVQVVGFRLTYSLEVSGEGLLWPGFGTHARVWVGIRYHTAGDPGSGLVEAWAVSPSLSPVEIARDLYGVAPPAAWAAPGNGGGTILRSYGSPVLQLRVDTNTAAMRVHEFYPLILDEDLLLGIAKAQVKVPAQSPRRVTVRGSLPPEATEHTITGWPGGDYTGQVARQTYREGTTVVDFEQAGAPPGVAQEAIEAERVRAARTRQVVETAGYALKMGERQ